MSGCVVLVNPAAHSGKALVRYRKMENALQARYPHQPVFTESADSARKAVLNAAESGAQLIAAAGGDGMVNLVLNALMDPLTNRARFSVTLGAIGLGSSNDFHKPRAESHDIGGVPVALGLETASWVDLGRADWVLPSGETGATYFLLNASMGATAKGNWRYNQPSGLLALFKRVSVDLAIQWATFETIAQFANVPARLVIDGQAQGMLDISNLGVIKRPFFCGNMRYDTPVTRDDGLFDINLCSEMKRLEFIQAVMKIEKGQFLGLPKTRHWRGQEVQVVPLAPAALELDGEVIEVSEVTFSVVPRALRVCGE
jgi:diacylglycerol kinase (ATP)